MNLLIYINTVKLFDGSCFQCLQIRQHNFVIIYNSVSLEKSFMFNWSKITKPELDGKKLKKSSLRT